VQNLGISIRGFTGNRQQEQGVIKIKGNRAKIIISAHITVKKAN
jgi:hypothetical protein